MALTRVVVVDWVEAWVGGAEVAAGMEGGVTDTPSTPDPGSASSVMVCPFPVLDLRITSLL